ncbi:hypothetical protein EMPS_08892 [Entomortierella parvispora]|uniref:Centromere protein H C-terminal domain-containing protein n=1 Tax=Entomortierella parvispora TaxID=205924 RepID=A0A9P3HHI3_9FUNG|nr:hypothetical protein EMPS_08892 [Entomortierella parvispora]
MATGTEAGADAGNAALLLTLEEEVLQLADHEVWLDAQIRDMEFALGQESDYTPPDNEPAEVTRSHLEQSIDILKQELSAAVTMDSVRTKVIESAQGYQLVLKSLFKSGEDAQSPLARAIEGRDKAVTEYLHVHRDLQKTRRELSAVQMQVLDSQDENRKLAQSLAEEAEAMKEALASQDTSSNRRMMQRTEEELKTVRMKHSVVSNVLQGLLLESDIDWANDPHYLDVMLKLKSPE